MIDDLKINKILSEIEKDVIDRYWVKFNIINENYDIIDVINYIKNEYNCECLWADSFNQDGTVFHVIFEIEEELNRFILENK